MRIVTLTNKGTGHLLNEKGDMTVCGLPWPGALGELRIEAYQDGFGDNDLYLCGNCEKVVESRGYEET